MSRIREGGNGRRRAVAAALAAFATVTVLGGCAEAGEESVGPGGAPTAAATVAPEAVEVVGRIPGTGALVAVVAAGDEVVAYVCNGDTLGERFFGTRNGDRAVLRAGDGSTVALTFVGGAVSGRFTRSGGDVPVSFTTEPATGDAGLYLADGVVDGHTYGAGWIVLGDGTQTGTAVRDGETRTAPRLVRGAPRKPPPTTTATKPTRVTEAPAGGLPPDLRERARKIEPVSSDVRLARLCSADPKRCKG